MTILKSFQRFWAGLRERVYRHHASVTDFGDIRRIQLVISFSLIIFVTCFAGALSSSAQSAGIVSSQILLVGMLLVSVACYVIARSRYFKISAYLLVIGFALSGFWLASERRDDPSGALFSTIPFALILGSILLSVRGQAALTAFSVIGTALLPRFFPEFTKMGRNSGLLLTMGGLLLIITLFRNELERFSLAEVTHSNAALKKIQANLEALVGERTRAAETARSQAEDARNEAETARKDLEAQMWLTGGQAALAEKMRGDQDVAQLADRIISQLGRYLGAQAGALYLLKNDTLRLAGGYAFSARPGFDGWFQMGEGLVGQAAADRRPLLVNRPDNTTTISSGLVDIAPRQVLVAPFEANDQVVGVVELATLTEFSVAQVYFLARVSESIGVAFRSAQARDRLAEVLLETQQQAEELQAQEEELRAANEELHAQAESLHINRKTSGVQHA